MDLDTFRPLEQSARRDDMVLALGRSDPLKNLPLTARGVAPAARAASRAVPVRPPARAGDRPRDPLCDLSRRTREVNELLNQATVFLQTSTHEGFCLPVLESMATGGAVVCTDAHGNRDYCVDGVNCLMPEPTPGRGGRRGAPPAGRSRPAPAPRRGRAGDRHRLRLAGADRRARAVPARDRAGYRSSATRGAIRLNT